jgi:hypothetical protein
MYAQPPEMKRTLPRENVVVVAVVAGRVIEVLIQ